MLKEFTISNSARAMRAPQHRARKRSQELSDDSLTMSPEEQKTKMRYTGKRGARTHPITGKRLAMSLSEPRPAMSRQASPATHEDRERSPRSRTPKSIEERLRNLEMQGSFNSNTVKDLKDALDNQIKMALELRRKVYTSKATVAECTGDRSQVPHPGGPA